MFGDAFGGQSQTLPSPPKDIVKTLDCTLHEFYNGSLKRVKFIRQLLCHDGKTTRPHQEEITVEVKPGMSVKDELVFKDKGSEAYGQKPSALRIKFRQIEDKGLQRKGNDLIYTHKITLVEALEGGPVKIVSNEK